MPYNELIKNFENIREYIREFYVYGFKSRREYDKKSSRSYDDARRRIESWLEDYIKFGHTDSGKNFFISVDTRYTFHNPLYRVWKTKSFTDGDITLYFILFDILYSNTVSLTINEIVDKIDSEYLSGFNNAKMFDKSTVRKKLKEYTDAGIITAEKNGKNVYYSRAETLKINCADALNFYSEVAPCGVVGSFLLDRTENYENLISFKHHYITQTLDSEILFKVFIAIKNKSEINITLINKRKNKLKQNGLIPLKVFMSAQNGRQYLMAYRISVKRFVSLRLDRIIDIRETNAADNFDCIRESFEKTRKNIWGVSTYIKDAEKQSVEFTVYFDNNEEYILKRLQREKRCGTVEIKSPNTARFYAEVYDANELLPWIRTFICRITDIKFSNASLQKQFMSDLDEMYKMYGIDRGAVQ